MDQLSAMRQSAADYLRQYDTLTIAQRKAQQDLYVRALQLEVIVSQDLGQISPRKMLQAAANYGRLIQAMGDVSQATDGTLTVSRAQDALTRLLEAGKIDAGMSDRSLAERVAACLGLPCQGSDARKRYRDTISRARPAVLDPKSRDALSSAVYLPEMTDTALSPLDEMVLQEQLEILCQEMKRLGEDVDPDFFSKYSPEEISGMVETLQI